MVWRCPMAEPLVHLEMISSPLGRWRLGAVNPKTLLGNCKQILLSSSQLMLPSCFSLLHSRTPCLWHCKWCTGWRQVCSLVSVWVCSSVFTTMAAPAQGVLAETNSSCRRKKLPAQLGLTLPKHLRSQGLLHCSPIPQTVICLPGILRAPHTDSPNM